MDGLPSGYGVSLLQTLLALVAVSALAWVLLRWLARSGLGQGGGVPGLRGTGASRIEVVERRLLDRHRVLWLVRVDGRGFLLGAGESGAPAVLAELSPDGQEALATSPGLAPRDPEPGASASPGAPPPDPSASASRARSFAEALSRGAGAGAGGRRG